MHKTTTIGELFTEGEMRKAAKLFQESPPGTFNQAVVREVITPEVMKRIDEKTGQKNDARFMGYALENALNQAKRR